MQDTGQGVKSVIIREGKFLVLIKPNGEQDLPGGRLESGESFEECLCREFLEETGLQVEIFNPIAHWSFIKNPAFLVTGVTYYCEYLSGKVELSHEHSDCFWSDLKEIDRHFLWRYFGEIRPSQLIEEGKARYGRIQ